MTHRITIDIPEDKTHILAEDIEISGWKYLTQEVKDKILKELK